MDYYFPQFSLRHFCISVKSWPELHAYFVNFLSFLEDFPFFLFLAHLTTVEISQNNHKLSGVIDIGINIIICALSVTVFNLEFLNFVER